MRHGAKPSKAKGEAKPPVARKSPKNDGGARVRDLEKRLAESLDQLQMRDRELVEARDQHTATSEILRVISRSPSDVAPVFATIARNAMHLLGGVTASVFLVTGDQVHLGTSELAGLTFPMSLSEFSRHRPVLAQVLTTRAPASVADMETDPRTTTEARQFARAIGFRSNAIVPMLRNDELIGLIVVARAEPRATTDDEIALLQTFADQAVIAIENVRLFKELEARNAQLTELLGQQTATGEILSVIARSPTDIQPVFDTVVESAARLCEANDVAIYRSDGDRLRFVAHHGSIPPPGPVGEYFRTLERGSATGRSVLEGRILHIADLQAEADEFPTGSDIARRLGFRALLSVPLIRGGAAIGTIMVRRTEARLFSERQVALLQTFADQAVIAIENVRLFTELQEKNKALSQAHAQVTEALERQTATSEILGVISSSPTDVQPVFEAVVRSAARLCDAFDALIFRLDTDVLRLVAHEGPISAYPTGQGPSLARGSLLGRAVLDRRTIHVTDMQTEIDEYPQGSVNARRFGHRTALAVPLLRSGEAIGVIAVRRTEVRPFTDRQVELLQTFADQAAIAIENVRLFKELELANRELSAASQHKSEFLANMSHELRTPLNAIIGFSEVLSERMFGELNEKQEEYSKDIHASGQHLLSLINDILDLSKIEAGRMELELTDFHLPQAIENALILVRERAGRRGITLEHLVDERLGEIRGDERKVKQVLLNLLSNALKFTPEGGRVEVRAGMVDGMAEISVTDTGVGIAPEDQEKVFEEFRQVGTAEKKAEGTGLGLTLCRKFIELHGGRIWVTSQVGVGSTFTFTIPVLRGE